MWKPPLNANLSPLSRADGSASCSTNDHSVVCAVNGPVEVMRRDELPEEAAIEVTVRPITGVGGLWNAVASHGTLCSTTFRNSREILRNNPTEHSPSYHSRQGASPHFDPSDYSGDWNLERRFYKLGNATGEFGRSSPGKQLAMADTYRIYRYFRSLFSQLLLLS